MSEDDLRRLLRDRREDQAADRTAAGDLETRQAAHEARTANKLADLARQAVRVLTDAGIAPDDETSLVVQTAQKGRPQVTVEIANTWPLGGHWVLRPDGDLMLPWEFSSGGSWSQTFYDMHTVGPGEPTITLERRTGRRSLLGTRQPDTYTARQPVVVDYVRDDATHMSARPDEPGLLMYTDHWQESWKRLDHLVADGINALLNR